MSSAEEIFNAMSEAVKTDKSIKKKIKASVTFQVDDGSGKTESFTLHAKDNSDGKADLVVTVSLQTLQQLLDKKMTPQQAFMKGKMKIKGKMSLAMKLTVLLNATRKYLKAQTSRL